MNQHKHPQSKGVINRLARLIGHLEAVKRMVEEERDCSDVLVQISAVMSALNKVGQIILEDHIRHCLVDGDTPASSGDLERLLDAIDSYLGTNSKRIESRH